MPNIWKELNRIYLPKEGKEDYSNSKSYRSISLTSTVSKTFECVVDSRFRAWLEELRLLDSFQYAYRKDHNQTQALLYYSLQATKGLKTAHTVSCYNDFEEAFDNVWWNAILYKLHKAGLRGRLFLYIVSFLSDRSIHSLVNDYVLGVTASTIGVPQGSVIAPVLFIFFISDLTECLGPHVGYTDDLSLWETNKDLKLTIQAVEGDHQKVSDWCYKWRTMINLTKTDVQHFTRSMDKKITV